MPGGWRMAEKISQKPEVWSYTDFRLYLQERTDWQKAAEKGFSLRSLSEKAGIRGSGSLSRVLRGQKNLGPELARSLAHALNLDDSEVAYFQCMTEFNQAKNYQARISAYKQMMRLAPPESVAHDQRLFKLYSRWYYPAILEILHYKTFRGNYKALAQSLNPAISEKQAREAIQVLQELELVVKTSKGLVRIPQKILSTGHHVQSLAVETFQMEMIDLSERAIREIERDKRNISTLTFSIPEKDFPALEEEIRRFRKRILKFISETEDEDAVYQMNLQCFPLTQLKKKD